MRKYPYYIQQNEDYEPEFIGWASNWDEALDLIDTSCIHEMTVIDVCDDDMIEGFKEDGTYYEEKD